MRVDGGLTYEKYYWCAIGPRMFSVEYFVAVFFTTKGRQLRMKQSNQLSLTGVFCTNLFSEFHGINLKIMFLTYQSNISDHKKSVVSRKPVLYIQWKSVIYFEAALCIGSDNSGVPAKYL